MILSLESTQTFLAQKTTQWLKSSFGVSIEVDKIHIGWNAKARIHSVVIRDTKNDTLIAGKNIETSILNFQSLIRAKLLFGDISADKLTLFITTYKGDSKNSLSTFIDQFGHSNSTSKKPFILQTQRLKITDAHLKITNHNLSQPHLFELEHIYIDGKYLKIKGFDVQTELVDASMIMNKNLKISQLKAFYRITDTLMLVSNGYVKTPYSKAFADVSFHYPKGGLTDFLNKVHLKANINAKQLASNDLNTFFKGFSQNETFQIQTHLQGTLNHFILKNVNAEYKQTLLKGNFSFENLFENSEVNMNFDIEQFTSNYDNISKLLNKNISENIPKQIKLLEKFTTKGNLSYSNHNLKTKLTIYAHQGSALVVSDIKNITSKEKFTYDATLLFKDFNLGKITQNAKLQHINASLQLKGKGLNTDKAYGAYLANISHLKFNDYDYQNISINSQLNHKKITASVQANDKNLKFNAQLQAHTNNLLQFQTQIVLDKANLYPLHFISDTLSSLQGKISLNSENKPNNQWTAHLIFDKILYKNTSGNFNFNQASLTYTNQKNQQKLQLKAPDIASGIVEGNFNWSEMIDIITDAGYTIFSSYKPQKQYQDKNIKFHLNIHNKIVEVFFPNIRIDKNTQIKGYIAPKEKQLQIQIQSPEIQINQYTLKQAELSINTENPSLVASLNVAVANSPYYTLRNIHLIGDVQNDTLSFHTQMKGGKNLEDYYKLEFFTHLTPENKLVIGSNPSKIYFKSNLWTIVPSQKKNHYISLLPKKEIEFKNITLKKDEQSIVFNGFFSENLNKDVSLTFNQVSLYDITPDISNFQAEGTINGNISFQQKNNWYYPESHISVQRLKINSYDIGNFEFLFTADESLSNFFINSYFENNQIRTAELLGNIRIQKEKILLDLNSNFNGLSIEPVNAFTQDILSGLQAYAFGNVHIGGSLNQIDMEGEITLKNAGISIPFLNVNTSFTDDVKIQVYPNSFVFQPVTLQDVDYKTQAQFKGSIQHKNLHNWNFDLNIDTENKPFLALNTQYNPKNSFFGKAFIIGDTNISGPIDKLNISVNAKTSEGTQFNIPLSNTTDDQDDSFITFVDKKKALTYKNNSNTGLNVSLDLNIDSEAQVKVILDKEFDNYLLANGEGGILIDLNTNGKFNIWGDYLIYSGTYNFAYKGLFERKFTLSPTGGIVWTGNPKTARLQNIEAVYKLYANPSVLLSSSSSGRNILTEVVIKLEGDLTHPIPSFDIRFPESNSALTSEINFYISNRDKKQIQSLSLLGQGTFLKEQSFANNDLTNSIYGTATGLFNRLISSDDDKFNLGVSYESENYSVNEIEKNNRLGVTFNTHLNDRWIINGKIGVPLGRSMRTSFGGDFEVQYLVNKKGSLRLKAFNRENDYQQYSSDKLGYIQGMGLFYRVDFSNFNELFYKIIHQK